LRGSIFGAIGEKSTVVFLFILTGRGPNLSLRAMPMQLFLVNVASKHLAMCFAISV